MIISITNPQDERIADYVNFRERDHIRNKRQFIAEGKTVLNVLAAQSRFKIRSLLILENRLDGIGPIIGKLDPETPIYVADKAVLNAIAGFDMHRGVLALAQAADDQDAIMDKATQWKTVVVLSGLSNHDNVGAIFRNCAAFGVDAVLMDKATCDPLYRKAIRVSVGGVFKVPYLIMDDVGALVDFLEAHAFSIVALSPNGETALHKWQPATKTALLLGTEGEGLEPEWLNRLQTIRVDMKTDFDSLNVAATAAIALHHLANRP